MTWIKTSERLPDLGNPVLVALPNKTYCIAAWDASDDCPPYWADEFDNFVAGIENSHWQPLPPLPEEQG